MSRRLHPTLADYLVIAVSPALIMTLVGSLVFFLTDLLYQGQYPERLHMVLALFVMASVLIGRIAIEIGSGHASQYAAVLAIVTLLTLRKFVRYPDEMAAFSLFINVGLIGLILWCSQKLTWDCTFIDESREESGEGVLRTMGLDPPQAKTSPPDAGVSSKQQIVEAAAAKPRRHSGGVWVVYFSVAALPLFGLGQRFLPPDDLDRRRYAFFLLCVYVASALGLLLTTSFLSLRRYLRGRRLRMPAAMAGTWVATGCILIAATLGFAILLPRPCPEYALSEVPWKATSEKRSASRYAAGKEGTEDSGDVAPRGETSKQPAASQSSDTPPKGPDDAAKNGANKRLDAQNETGRDAENKTSRGAISQLGAQTPDPSDAPPGHGRARPDSSSARQSETPQVGDKTNQGKAATSEAKGETKSGQSVTSGERQASAKLNRAGQTASPDSTKSEAKGDSRQPTTSAPSSPVFSPAGGWALSGAWKWLFYLGLIAAAIYALWRSRAALAQTLRELAEMWRALWASWFGQKDSSRQAAAENRADHASGAVRPFAAFPDPFAAGWAQNWSSDELVRYSFAALEAWGREHGCAREPEETPREFAEKIAGRSTQLKGPCLTMAELYCRAAYAGGGLPRASVAALREFWQQLTSA